MRSLLYLNCACAVTSYEHGGHTCTRHLHTPFGYAITKTPYAFFAKITLCMYLLYASKNVGWILSWGFSISLQPILHVKRVEVNALLKVVGFLRVFRFLPTWKVARLGNTGTQ